MIPFHKDENSPDLFKKANLKNKERESHELFDLAKSLLSKYQSCASLYDLERNKKAVFYLNACKKNNPSPEVDYYLAEAYFRPGLNNNEKALFYIDKFLNFDPSNLKALSLKLKIFERINHPHFLNLANKLLCLEPQNKELRLKRADYYYSLHSLKKNKSEIKACLDLAIEDYNYLLSEGYESALEERLRAHQKKLEFDLFDNQIIQQCLDDYDCLIKKNKSNSNLYLRRAKFYHEILRSPEKAISDYNQAVSLDREYGNLRSLKLSLQERAIFFEASYNYSESIQDLEDLIDLNSNHETRFNHSELFKYRIKIKIAYLNALRGHKDQSLQIIKRVLKYLSLTPIDDQDKEDFSFYLIETYRLLQKNKKAFKILQSMDVYSNSALFLFFEACFEESEGNFDNSKNKYRLSFERIESQTPPEVFRKPQHSILMAVNAIHLNKYVKAFELLDQVIDNEKKNFLGQRKKYWSAFYWRAWMLEKRNEFRRAYQDYQQALQWSPKNKIILLSLARLSAKMGLEGEMAYYLGLSRKAVVKIDYLYDHYDLIFTDEKSFAEQMILDKKNYQLDFVWI